MAAIDTVPTNLAPSYDEKLSNGKANSHSDSFSDEKPGEKDVDLTDLALHTDVGDVFDGPRLIDLGEDGKERPIGKTSVWRSYWNIC